jgi:hypothetical protein
MHLPSGHCANVLGEPENPSQTVRPDAHLCYPLKEIRDVRIHSYVDCKGSGLCGHQVGTSKI